MNHRQWWEPRVTHDRGVLSPGIINGLKGGCLVWIVLIAAGGWAVLHAMGVFG